MFKHLRIFAAMNTIPAVIAAIFHYGMFANSPWPMGLGVVVLVVAGWGGLRAVMNKEIKAIMVDKHVSTLIEVSKLLNHRWLKAFIFSSAFWFLTLMLTAFYTRHYILMGMALFVFATEVALGKEALLKYGAVKYIYEVANFFSKTENYENMDEAIEKLDKVEEALKEHWTTEDKAEKN